MASLQKNAWQKKKIVLERQKLQTQCSLIHNPIASFELLLQQQRVAPAQLKMCCSWGLIQARASQKCIPGSGTRQATGTHIFWVTGDGRQCVGAAQPCRIPSAPPRIGTHPYNHHLHRHVLRQPDGSSEMHGQSHQQVKDGNQILAMDGCREQGR